MHTFRTVTRTRIVNVEPVLTWSSFVRDLDVDLVSADEEQRQRYAVEKNL